MKLATLSIYLKPDQSYMLLLLTLTYLLLTLRLENFYQIQIAFHLNEFIYRVNYMILSTACNTHVNKGVHWTKDQLLT